MGVYILSQANERLWIISPRGLRHAGYNLREFGAPHKLVELGSHLQDLRPLLGIMAAPCHRGSFQAFCKSG